MRKQNGQEGPWVFPKTRASRAEYLEFVKVLQEVGTTCSRFFRKVIREVERRPFLLLGFMPLVVPQ